MNPMISFSAALIASLLFAPHAIACRTSSTHRYPTLEENFKRADAVFVGRITDSKLTANQKTLKFKVEKAWKKAVSMGPLITAAINEPTSCDRLGYEKADGQLCLIFLNANGTIISHMLEGETSFCLDQNSPRSATLIKEYDDKFKKL